MEKRDILETLINHYCEGNKAKFAGMIGVKPQLISNWIKRNTFDYEQVYAGCPNLSGDFLLSGQGNVYRSKQNDNMQDESELLSLCKSLVENYQQRDNVIKQLASMIEGI